MWVLEGLLVEGLNKPNEEHQWMLTFRGEVDTSGALNPEAFRVATRVLPCVVKVALGVYSPALRIHSVMAEVPGWGPVPLSLPIIYPAVPRDVLVRALLVLSGLPWEMRPRHLFPVAFTFEETHRTPELARGVNEWLLALR